MNRISAADLKAKLDALTPLNLLDVREKIEFMTFNIGGVNIPVGHLERQADPVPYNKIDEIIVICSKGIRSEHACELLTAQGFKNVVNLQGGLIALRRLSHL